MALASVASARQKGRTPKGKAGAGDAAAAPMLTRTTARHETRRFGFGGTLTVYGAPAGLMTIESWPRNDLDITADIELHANTEEDLARLAAVNNFFIDSDFNHIIITTTGTHDRKFMKRVGKDFPKRLLGLPWKIDYHIRVPANTDLELYSGRGPVQITNVEGALRLSAGEGKIDLTLAGGDVAVTVQSGTINLSATDHSWRGRGADIRLAQGDLTVELPPDFNADINADIYQAGRIENTYSALKPRDDPQQQTLPASERSLHGRAGGGGATLSFSVGAGTIRIRQRAESAGP